MAHYKSSTSQSTEKESIYPLFLNNLNIMVGAGVLTVPFAYNAAKFYIAVLTTIFYLIAALTSFIFYSKDCKNTKQSTLSACYRSSISYLTPIVDLVVVIYCVFSLSALIIVLGEQIPYLINESINPDDYVDLKPGVIPSSQRLTRTLFLLCMFFAYLLPISFLKDLKFVSYLAFLTLLIGVLFIVIAVYVFVTVLLNPNDNDFEAKANFTDFMKFGSFGGFIQCASMLNISFNPHFLACQVYSEMKRKSVRRFGKAAGYAFLSAAVFYLIFGVLTVFTFGENVDDNVINNYKGSKWIYITVSVAQSFSVCFSFPAFFQTLRITSMNMLDYTFKMDLLENHEEGRNKWIYFSLVIFLNTLSLLIGLVFMDLGKLIELNGAVFGTLIVFVIPTVLMIYLKEKNKKYQFYASVFLVTYGVFGLVMGILGVFGVV
eukprot:GAHX01002417.1.p1 GENE.GAHX01002417.1~~GAHX01002417.1.p1  ORF type:complete len:432 (-),score=58.54 GAHX01002417.1:260-1555(-)